METKRNVYSLVYRSLMVGMSISTALFVGGVSLQLARGAGLQVFDPIPLMKIGTVAMILTPVSRVAVSIVAFAVDRDYRFAGITSFVLVMIAISVLLGLSGLHVRG
jgi:uncharacterized membrane protein